MEVFDIGGELIVETAGAYLRGKLLAHDATGIALELMKVRERDHKRIPVEHFIPWASIRMIYAIPADTDPPAERRKG